MGRAKRPQKSPKRCFFCGTAGSITKEHAWPRWLAVGAVVEPTQTTRRMGFSRTGTSGYSEAPTTETVKQGSALTTKIREVCKNCNTGWMSQLEQDAQPLLRRLGLPGYPLGETTLSHSEAQTVSAWATKTAWVRERVSPGRVTPPLATRAQFAIDQVPPEYTTVWIARHSGQNNFGVYVSQIETRHHDHPHDSSLSRNILLCTLTFNGISILVRTDDGWGVPPSTPAADRWTQFWPMETTNAHGEVAESICWPPSTTVSDLDILMAASRVSDWLNMGPI